MWSINSVQSLLQKFKQISEFPNINWVELQNDHFRRALIYFNNTIIFKTSINFYMGVEFTARKNYLCRRK